MILFETIYYVSDGSKPCLRSEINPHKVDVVSKGYNYLVIVLVSIGSFI